MADHDGKDLESEVNRILGALKLEDIRNQGIKKLPEEQLKKAQAGFQIDVQRLYFSRLSANQRLNFKQKFEIFSRTKKKVLPIYVAMQVITSPNNGTMILWKTRNCYLL